ncbi:ALQxL family class IV lanthipeptide [Amycolatopsis antarctica]
MSVDVEALQLLPASESATPRAAGCCLVGTCDILTTYQVFTCKTCTNTGA